MKRVLAALLTMLALAACASPLAKAETPQQALDAAAQRASQLKSAKFDLQGNVKMTFPAQLGTMLGQSGAAAGSISLDMTGTGEAQFPDRYHAVINAKMSGMSIATEVVVANGKAYVKNPLSGKWQVSASSGLTSQFSQPDPLSYEQLLKNVKSIKDLGDTTLDGTAVHHYQLVPDKDKLLAAMDKAAVKNPQALAAIKQVLDSGTMTVEVWFGKDASPSADRALAPIGRLQPVGRGSSCPRTGRCRLGALRRDGRALRPPVHDRPAHRGALPSLRQAPL